MTTNEKKPVVPTVVRELISKSHEIQGWLVKLVDHADEAYLDVFERVKKDYTDRLKGVAEELTTHRSDLVSDLEARRGTVKSLRADHESHTADMEEVRLRHVVGELSEEEWESRNTTIESARNEVDSVLAVEEDAVAELATVVDSVDRIVGREKPPTPRPIATVVAPRVEKAAPAAQAYSWSAVVSGMKEKKHEQEEPRQQAGVTEDELAFLETVSTDDFRETDPIVAAMLDDE